MNEQQMYFKMRDKKDVIVSAKKFGRRSRPRAKSVDSQYQPSGVESSSFEIARFFHFTICLISLSIDCTGYLYC